MRARLRRQAVAAFAAFACAGSAARVSAQGPFEGTWTAGTTTMDVAIESWGADCGPQPVSTRSQGGGSVTVGQSGNELTIHARGRQVQTNTCWSQNPAMRKSASTYANGVWTTQCRTPQNDPREELGTYTLNAETPDRLRYRDVSKYNWKLKSSTCVATITTTQTLNRTAATSAKPSETPKPAPAPPPPEPPLEPWPDEQAESGAGCTPGAPARLSLRPSEATIELGQRACFRARVADARGCALPKAEVEWSLAHSDAVRGALEGHCFVAGQNAAEAEGEFRLVARYRTLRARAKVRVRAPDLSALLAKRLETGAITGFGADSAQAEAADAGPAAASDTPAPQPARVGARAAGQAPSAVGGSQLVLGAGALGVLLLGALLWTLRRRRVPGLAATPSEPPAVASELPSAPLAAASDPAPPGTGEAWICPTCRQGFAHQGSCPKDGAALIAYASFVQQHRARDEAPHKRCPRCGERYPSSSVFCGRDGSPLENVV
jgi:hypothetical protein